MKRMLSLRARILIGAVLWTAGLFRWPGWSDALMLLAPAGAGCRSTASSCQLLPVSS